MYLPPLNGLRDLLSGLLIHSHPVLPHPTWEVFGTVLMSPATAALPAPPQIGHELIFSFPVSDRFRRESVNFPVQHKKGRLPTDASLS
jgi:hypothetical protein